jgi:ubiquinone/menaquinone biosynthesis C-methylase UbiE
MPTHDRDYVTQINQQYHDAIAERYDDRFEGQSPEVLEWVRAIFKRDIFPTLQAFGGTPQVLDVGCGSGYLPGFLEEGSPVPVDVLGVDISEGMLARARERFPQWRFEQHDLYEFDPGQQYHLVMENAVLHHLVDYETLLDRMAALTLPGGMLYLGNEPNRLAYRYLSPAAKLWRATINRYRTEDAEALLGDAEFESISEYHLFYGQGIDAHGIKRRLQDHGFRRVEIYFSYRELFSAVEEAYPKVRLNRWTPSVIRDGFPLSRNFILFAQK